MYAQPLAVGTRSLLLIFVCSGVALAQALPANMSVVRRLPSTVETPTGQVGYQVFQSQPYYTPQPVAAAALNPWGVPYSGGNMIWAGAQAPEGSIFNVGASVPDVAESLGSRLPVPTPAPPRLAPHPSQGPIAITPQRPVAPQASVAMASPIAPQSPFASQGPLAPQSSVVTDSAVTPLVETVVDESGITEVGFNRPCGCGVSPGCCDVGCCGDACCCPVPVCRPTYWVGGVEATFLAPDANDSFVSFLVEDNISTPTVNESFGTNDVADIDSLYVAPRLWVGIQRCNWGLRARYWHLRADSDAYDPFSFAPSGFEGLEDIGYFAFNQLDMYTIDVEGTYSFCACRVKNTLSFGVRYASADHVMGLSTQADVDDGASGTGILQGRAYAQRTAEGTGLTGSWYARKPLFCNSCIHLIGGMRGSVLWGDSVAIAETGVLEAAPGGFASSTNSAFVSQDDAMFIGEAQLGLQWDYRVQCFPADAFFRIAAEYQFWSAADGAAIANSFAGFGTAPNNSQGTADAVANTIDLDLYGFSIATGFTW